MTDGSWFQGVTFDLGQLLAMATAGYVLWREYKKNRKERAQNLRAEGREVYQRLELASVELFRAENENEDLLRALWFDHKLPKTDVARRRLQNHVCQTLNLFEMAYRLHRSGVMPNDAFRSWVFWIMELCESDAFPPLWNELRLNYIRDFRALLDAGVRHSHPGFAIDTSEPKALSFYERLFAVNSERAAQNHAPSLELKGPGRAA